MKTPAAGRVLAACHLACEAFQEVPGADFSENQARCLATLHNHSAHPAAAIADAAVAPNSGSRGGTWYRVHEKRQGALITTHILGTTNCSTLAGL